MKLDKKDKRLLSLLSLNSRMSFVQMGKRLALGGLAVERRLRRLESEGIIGQMCARVAPQDVGFGEYRLFFRFDVMDTKTEREVLGLFESYPRTGWGVIAEGEYQALWRIYAKSPEEVEEAKFLMMKKFGKRITAKAMATTIYEKWLPWNRAFGTERGAQAFPKEARGKNKLDGTDLEIISMLAGNSREKSTAIAKKIGISPDAVNYRVRRLVKEGIIREFTAWFDARKLGYNYYKILITLQDADRGEEKRFVEYCLQNYTVVYLNKILGSWDLEIDAIVENNEELHDFIRGIKTRFENVVGQHMIISVVAEVVRNPLREK